MISYVQKTRFIRPKKGYRMCEKTINFDISKKYRPRKKNGTPKSFFFLQSPETSKKLVKKNRGLKSRYPEIQQFSIILVILVPFSTN